MNDIDRHPPASGSPPEPATTQVADGLPRRAWTVYEVERMLEVGILREPEPFELIGGELVAMAPKDRRHEVLRTELTLYWARRMGRDLKFASETPLRLGEHDAPEPDLIVFPASLLAPDVRADTVLLVVEVAELEPPRRPQHQSPTLCGGGCARVLGNQCAQPRHHRVSRAAPVRRVRLSSGAAGDGHACPNAGALPRGAARRSAPRLSRPSWDRPGNSRTGLGKTRTSIHRGS